MHHTKQNKPYPSNQKKTLNKKEFLLILQITKKNIEINENMQANNWKQRTKQLGNKKPRSLHPYPIKQVFYSRSTKKAVYFQGIPQA